VDSAPAPFPNFVDNRVDPSSPPPVPFFLPEGAVGDYRQRGAIPGARTASDRGAPRDGAHGGCDRIKADGATERWMVAQPAGRFGRFLARCRCSFPELPTGPVGRA